jgi:hypothetical protein
MAVVPVRRRQIRDARHERFRSAMITSMTAGFVLAISVTSPDKCDE